MDNQPKYTLQRTGAEVADAIEKALASAKRAATATTVVTEVKFKDNKTVYSATVNEDTLVLTAVALETTTDDIYEAEQHSATNENPTVTGGAND